MSDLKEVSGTVARMGKSWPGVPGTEISSILMLIMSSVMSAVCLPRLATWVNILPKNSYLTRPKNA